MKKYRWRYGVVSGLALVCMISGLKTDVLAAGKKTGRTGADIIAKAEGSMKAVESIKITVDLIGSEGTGTAKGKETVENGTASEGAEGVQGTEALGNGEEDELTGETEENKEKEEGGEEALDEEEAQEAEGGKEGEEAREENADEIDAYFDDSVFVGDSIMLGFRNYAMKRQDTFLSRMNFLAAGSFSANNALWDVGEKSVHPVYQGEQRQIWDSISMMGSKKVFIMLGMNDLNITGLEGSCEIYQELIGKIKESNPDVEIHIMSMTYILKGEDVGKLENNAIREFNGMLREMAEGNGWGFVDVAEALADENGDLAAEYCSDGFAHQNPEAYDVWVSVLRKYAGEHLE